MIRYFAVDNNHILIKDVKTLRCWFMARTFHSRLWEKCDENRDGKIQYEEFLKSLVSFEVRIFLSELYI